MALFGQKIRRIREVMREKMANHDDKAEGGGYYTDWGCLVSSSSVPNPEVNVGSLLETWH